MKKKQGTREYCKDEQGMEMDGQKGQVHVAATGLTALLFKLPTSSVNTNSNAFTFYLFPSLLNAIDI